MKESRFSYRFSVVLLIPLGLLLVYFSSGNPKMVEQLYSETVYPPIGRILSRLTGVIPLSVAEIIVLVVPVVLIAYVAAVLKKSFGLRGFSMIPILNFAVNMLMIISFVFFSFITLWGLNYYRQPFADLAGLQIRPSSVQELESLCSSLIDRANTLRQSVNVNADGYVDVPGSTRDILRGCSKGYTVIAERYPQLGGSYGDPKPILLSVPMNYTGICGVYFPFTGEANVNVSIPEVTLPSTAAHEMAHQRGFSREDEANYIAYLACSSHPDVNYRYSGVLLAMIHSMNALYRSDSGLHSRLAEGFSPEVRKDMDQINEFWKKYEGPVEETTERMNNTYLKANNQKDGVQSYGRMVDLLLAEYRQEYK